MSTHDPDRTPATHDPGPFDPIPGKCNSRKTNGTGLCRNAAGKGTDHVGHGACSRHGGCTPNGNKHAERLATADSIAALLAEFQPDVESVDPHRELLEVVALTSGMRRVLTQLVGELGPFGTPAYIERPVGPKGGELEPTYTPADPAGIYGPDHKGDGKPHVLVEMLRVWTVDNARASKLAIDAGIDERRVRIVEEQAEQLVTVMRAALAALVDRVAEVSGDQSLVRDLTAFLPTAIRGAIESSGVIDAQAVET